MRTSGARSLSNSASRRYERQEARGINAVGIATRSCMVLPPPFGHSTSLAGYPGGQVVNSGEECPQDRRRVRLMISDDQIDGRRLAFQGTADDRPLQEI